MKTKYEAFMDFIELIIHKSNNNYTSISRSLGLSDSYISGIKYRCRVSDAVIIKTLNKYNSSKFRDSEEYKNLSKYVLINKHTIKGDYYNPLEEKFYWCGFEWRCDQLGNVPFHFDSPNILYDPSKVTITKDGMLRLSVGKCHKKFNFAGKDYAPEIGIGLVRLCENNGYGIYTVEAKLPEGKFLWPAFWNWGVKSWPPEIDWLEAWTNCFGNYYKFPFKYKIQSAYSSQNAGDLINTAEFCNISALKKPHKNFNKYQLLWRENYIAIKYNDVIVREISGDAVKQFNNKTMCLILNVNVVEGKFDPKKHKPKSDLLIKKFSYQKLWD